MLNHKILYLDDEENNLIAFKALFRRDYEIFTTTSPQEAVQFLNENEVQLILSDQKMPDISGVEFFELTRTDFPDAIRVLVTGYADIEAVIDAINKGGVYRYVTKPWNENDLRICIENAFEKYYTKREIDTKSEELAQANSDLEKFIYSASHDLRSPLVSIKGVIQLAKTEAIEGKAAEYFDMIEKSVSKLDSFVQNIIHYYQNIKTEDASQIIDIEQLVSDVVNQYRSYENYDAVEIKKAINVTGDFYGDSYRLKIVLGNILANALKFIDATKTTKTLEIEVIQNVEKLLLRISDNGLGMNDESLKIVENIFNNRDNRGPGNGVGLYLVRDAVQRMNGKIQVSSTMGTGSKFIIEIPNKA
ncbi:MAG: hybrid sensor histidine kinase/response regulator [Flavobacteriales bacterium]